MDATRVASAGSCVLRTLATVRLSTCVRACMCVPSAGVEVVILHHMLSKAVVKARPSVLWCYKKELGFNR